MSPHRPPDRRADLREAEPAEPWCQVWLAGLSHVSTSRGGGPPTGAWAGGRGAAGRGAAGGNSVLVTQIRRAVRCRTNYEGIVSVNCAKPRASAEAVPRTRARTSNCCRSRRRRALDTCGEHASFNSGSVPLPLQEPTAHRPWEATFLQGHPPPATERVAAMKGGPEG